MDPSRVARAGPALRLAHAARAPGIRRAGLSVAGARHCRQRRPVERHARRPASSVAIRAFRSAGSSVRSGRAERHVAAVGAGPGRRPPRGHRTRRGRGHATGFAHPHRRRAAAAAGGRGSHALVLRHAGSRAARRRHVRRLRGAIGQHRSRRGRHGDPGAVPSGRHGVRRTSASSERRGVRRRRRRARRRRPAARRPVLRSAGPGPGGRSRAAGRHRRGAPGAADDDGRGRGRTRPPGGGLRPALSNHQRGLERARRGSRRRRCSAPTCRG